MRLVIQRVKEAAVDINSIIIGKINEGMLIFLGIGKEDTTTDVDFLVQKALQVRIFDDQEGKMNLSALDVKAEFLVVSQFTLYGDCNKGRRPSFDLAASPEKAEELYNYFVKQLRLQNVRVETGQFRATMNVSLINDGPVTFIIESRS